jgi:uncharacterized protein YbjT (DUF2867 family)
MNIVIGASGRVGSNVIRQIKNMNGRVRAVVRNPDKLEIENIDVRVADLHNAEELINACEGGTALFVITPENPASEDIIGETKQIISNYRKAIKACGIQKVVGISSMGAHADGNTGNLQMSRMLEEAFDDMDITRIFIRPSYYFSNWLPSAESVMNDGVLPTFFPEDFEIEMNSPTNVALVAAKMMVDMSTQGKRIIEIAGPQKYTSRDVASVFSNILQRDVTVHTIPEEEWKPTLMSMGFTESTASNMADMTRAVLDGSTKPENPAEMILLATNLREYMTRHVGVPQA